MVGRFKKRLIDKVAFEACSVFDVNRDGALDIVCGENWYEGPDFTKKHKICDITFANEYHHDFSDYPMDVNGDGYLDYTPVRYRYERGNHPLLRYRWMRN